MNEHPTEYRPPYNFFLWLIPVALVAAPVAIYFVAPNWLLITLVALIGWPGAVFVIILLRDGPFLRVTDEGVCLRTYEREVNLAWADIGGFEAQPENLVIRMRNGERHHVTWVNTSYDDRRAGRDGPAEYMADDLNGLPRFYHET